MLNVICSYSNVTMDLDLSNKRKKTRRGKKRGRKMRCSLLSKTGLENNGKIGYKSCLLKNINNGNEYNELVDSEEPYMDNLLSRLIRDENSALSCRSTNRHRVSKSNSKVLRPMYSPKAPHNSTQFLMDEHQDFMFGDQLFPNVDHEFYSQSTIENKNNPKEMTSDVLIADAMNNNEQDFTEQYETSFDFGQIDSVTFMMNDFDHMYDTIRAEQLSYLSKDELITAVKNLEHEVNLKERKLICTNSQSLGLTPKKMSKTKSDLQELLSELDALTSENQTMKKEIERLHAKDT